MVELCGLSTACSMITLLFTQPVLGVIPMHQPQSASTPSTTPTDLPVTAPPTVDPQPPAAPSAAASDGTNDAVSEYENIAKRLTLGCMTGGYSCNCPSQLFNRCQWRYRLDASISRR